MKPEFAEQRRKARRNRPVSIQCHETGCDLTVGVPKLWPRNDKNILRQFELDELIARGEWFDVYSYTFRDIRSDPWVWAAYGGKCRECHEAEEALFWSTQTDKQRELF